MSSFSQETTSSIFSKKDLRGMRKDHNEELQDSEEPCSLINIL